MLRRPCPSPRLSRTSLSLHLSPAIPSLLPTVRHRPSDSGRPNHRARIHAAATALPPTGAAPPAPESHPCAPQPGAVLRPCPPRPGAAPVPLPSPPPTEQRRCPCPSPRPEQCRCNQELVHLI
ncbi:hypothetical protein PAHAL_2G273400 [Panicum hallii]|uniref:Uncharacterized protein n=1 Tax=Panicum hallii TaxID=206008 RepID=A0A2T8KQN3_9POAL|nr:hypothetical protein PAHAL_2G273400 [Panicum hallii]